MANNMWVIWIDNTTAPGILRGLWPINSSGGPSPYWEEPGRGLKSLIRIVQGFFGPNNPTW